ncbi:MAG TPA: hypothetical protein P5234_01580 [Thermoanaerobaculaceae bacterium]|nr:hypothetical protein [Thermoanaerobaculaceae bacterium]HRS14917.1 hypothetical protein [Thermoanaerobaculaceae bacterium]
MRRSLPVLGVLSVAGTLLAAPPPPRFPGAATTVVVNRADGRVAAVVGAKLLLLDSLTSDLVTRDYELPGREQAVREFRGNTVVYSTRSVADMPFVLVALHVDGRERLAWPNEGLSELFPTERSRLTLDGRGLYGELVLDRAVREYFELPEDIPLGAGVAATYRFAGEKMSARASEVFRQVVGLTPDDMLIALRDGGVLRYKAGEGVVWRQDIPGEPWRLVDVDDRGGQLLGLEAGTVLRCLSLDRGELRWEWRLASQASVIRAALGLKEAAPAQPPAARPRRSAAPATPEPAPVRVRDARLLRAGRVLLYGDQPRRFLLVLDPVGNRVVGEEVLGALPRRELEVVASWWLEEATDLSAAWEMPGSAGVSLLLRGTDGWHVVPVTLP